MEHSFDTEIAEQHGVNCAIIYKNLSFWCAKNKANNKNFFDGNFWTYNSVKAWRELFPYLGESQIKTALRKLEEAGLILSGEYNANKYDRTKWFSIVELVVLANGEDDNSQPIPDNKPDNKPDTNLESDFERVWKFYTTELKEKGNSAGSKKEALKNYIDLITKKKVTHEDVSSAVRLEANKKLGIRHLKRVLRVEEVEELLRAFKDGELLPKQQTNTQTKSSSRNIGGYTF